MNRKQIRNAILILLVCAVVSGAFHFFLKYRESREPSHLRQVMGTLLPRLVVATQT